MAAFGIRVISADLHMGHYYGTLCSKNTSLALICWVYNYEFLNDFAIVSVAETESEIEEKASIGERFEY